MSSQNIVVRRNPACAPQRLCSYIIARGQQGCTLFTDDAAGLNAEQVCESVDPKNGGATFNHFVISIRPDKYLQFGEDESSREQALMERVRGLFPEYDEGTQGTQARWFAGIHTNTDTPHVHLVTSGQNAFGGFEQW